VKHITYKSCFLIALTYSLTNLMLLMLYFSNLSLNVKNNLQFSSWLSILGSYIDDRKIESYFNYNRLFLEDHCWTT
jgi:hypothetical protein